jgi:hypothetical protein
VPSEEAGPRLPGECRGSREAPEAAEEGGLVALGFRDDFGAGESADVREARVPVPPALGADLPQVGACEDGVPRDVPLALEEELRELAPGRRRNAAIPLDEGDELELSRREELVGQREPPELGGGLRVGKEGPVGRDPAKGRAERRVAESVPALEPVVVREAGRGRERPDLSRIDVAQVQMAPRGVPGQVLLPARHDGELGVVDPGESGPCLADDEAGSGVGDDVDPGAWSPRVGDDVLAAVLRETPVGIGGLDGARGNLTH